MVRMWLYRKPNTNEGLFLVPVGNHVMWAKTVDDKIVSEFEKDTLTGFCQMKSDEGYELDENTYFTFSKDGIHDLYREDPCSKE